ncbi:MAG: TRAP transporter substrate-binding protein DctP [Brachymonas sp.]|nr:TRAP transporter substrate-binding protein DctP [Brachymonas sp.]
MTIIFSRLLKISALLILTAASTICVGQTKLKAWSIHPDSYPVSQALQFFADDVKKSTAGRYEVEVITSAGGLTPGTTITPEKAQEMLLKGEIDFAVSNVGPLSQKAPSIKVLSLPFLFTDSEHMFKQLDGKLGKQFEEKLQTVQFKVLGWYDGGARSFYCVQPINAMTDFANLRIRVIQSEVYLEMVKLIGGQPKSVPFKEVLGAFQEGKIDCAENNMPSFESTEHYKVAKNMLVTNHVVAAEVLLISPKLFASLSADDKQKIEKSGRQSSVVMRDLWKKRVASSQEIASKSGVKFVRLKDPATMVRKLGPLYGKYMNDPATRSELLTIIANQN